MPGNRLNRRKAMQNTPQMLCSGAEMADAVKKLAGDIYRGAAGIPGGFALVGIHQQGVTLAGKLQQILNQEYNCFPDSGTLDISMYRDDIGNRSQLPVIRETRIPFDVNDRTIILIDDVLSTGRTIRAALDAITDFGRPGRIRLAVLVDRDDAEFPIRADYVGMKLRVPDDHKIKVWFENAEGREPGIYDINWPK